jgi:hypothetical protein
MKQFALMIVAGVAALCASASASHAQTYGDAQWCAVISPTDGNIQWDCFYRSAAECAPNVIAGQRGFCNVNPYWTGRSALTTTPVPHRKHYATTRPG